MTQEALKLALEWAEAHGEIVFAGGGMDAVNKMNSWATAIKEALREHAMREVQRLGQEIEQEPVAKVVCNSAGQISMQTLDGNSFDISKYVGSMFYTTPPKQGKEPVAIRLSNGVIDVLGTAIVPIGALLYTTPPQRTWVGLTHEEVEEVWEQVESSDFLDCVHPLARAIEARLRELNT